ncbi:SRPBCC domain-containing protein [Candidatus Saccharibacteria bacterium]|nr:SRPBCC domain-containing protein [Candidatus Saccharibacteria bacterium]
MAEIKQTEKFEGASAQQVYDALMSSKQHAEFTGAAANIDNTVGGKITAWDEYIEGENIVLEPGTKIVQKWRASDWPEGEWSEATFELKDVDDDCELVFTQVRVPESMVKDVEQGWVDYYWKPLKKYLAKK